MEIVYENLLTTEWNQVVMWIIGAILIYLAIAKDMEPSLLLPMAPVYHRHHLPPTHSLVSPDPPDSISVPIYSADPSA